MPKATTLLYLADEHAVRKTGAPILWLSYQADVNGPMMVETFPTQLLRSPIKAFIDDEFSDCEINILQDIVDRYGRYTDKELVEILGRKMAYEFQILVYRLVMRRSDGSFGELGWFQALS